MDIPHYTKLNRTISMDIRSYRRGAAMPGILAGLLTALIGLVMCYGMRIVVWRALLVLFVLSVAIALASNGYPPLWLLSIDLLLIFFCAGILFGNNNALAMQPLGHVAGIGAAVVGSLSTLISTPLGTVIGRFYNGSVIPLLAGIAILTAVSIIVVRWTENRA